MVASRMLRRRARSAVQLPDIEDGGIRNERADVDIPATDNDNLTGLQWDMVQIHVLRRPHDHR